jgi:hypothetical protein
VGVLGQEGFGPDRISDMTTNVILGDLLAFNDRILPSLSVPIEPIMLRLRNGRTFEAKLPINPFVKGKSPVVLVPGDILRDLPIAILVSLKPTKPPKRRSKDITS